MGKRIKLIILGVSILGIALASIVLILITKEDDTNGEKDNVYNGSIIESTPTEKLVIPLTEYYDLVASSHGVLIDYYEGWEKVQVELVHGEIRKEIENEYGYYCHLNVGNKYEMSKDNSNALYLINGIELNEKNNGDRIVYASFIFLEDEHIVAQSFVVMREDMEGIVSNPFYGTSDMNYYATPIKEVQYKKIEGKYQNVTKEYADAWFNSNMEEYEIKKAVETAPEKSRFKITENYSTDFTIGRNEEETYKANGISVEYELQNENQYVKATTDNGNISGSKNTDSWSEISAKYWLDSENFEKDKYDNRVAYIRLMYREHLKYLGLALIKIEYKDDTKTSYTTQIKEVAYEPIDGRSQYISDATAEAWFERAISEFEQETTP